VTSKGISPVWVVSLGMQYHIVNEHADRAAGVLVEGPVEIQAA
jgi:hypothetical protein